MEVDWSGPTMELSNAITGAKAPVILFIACLPFSRCSFCWPSLDMKQSSWLRAHLAMFEALDSADLQPARTGNATQSARAMAQARHRLGPALLPTLFDLLRGPVPTGQGRRGVWWHGRLVCAVEGAMMYLPDTEANLAVYRKGGGHHGGTGYPMVRVLALVACGTRSLIDAAFGPTSVGETTSTHRLPPALHERMILLADRNFAAAKRRGSGPDEA